MVAGNLVFSASTVEESCFDLFFGIDQVMFVLQGTMSDVNGIVLSPNSWGYDGQGFIGDYSETPIDMQEVTDLPLYRSCEDDAELFPSGVKKRSVDLTGFHSPSHSSRSGRIRHASMAKVAQVSNQVTPSKLSDSSPETPSANQVERVTSLLRRRSLNTNAKSTLAPDDSSSEKVAKGAAHGNAKRSHYNSFDDDDDDDDDDGYERFHHVHDSSDTAIIVLLVTGSVIILLAIVFAVLCFAGYSP